jgi:hypothetical protein
VVLWGILLLFFFGSREVAAQTSPVGHANALMSRLLTAIRQIRIIDTDAHPALPDDREAEALTFDSSALATQEALALSLRFRSTNLELVPAFQALYGYPYADLSLEHLRELTALKRKKRTLRDANYFNAVLDQAGIAVSLANRVGMNGTPLDRQCFKWVPSIDAFLFPLNNSVYKNQHADFQIFFSSVEEVLDRYFALVETSRPRRFDAYLRAVHDSIGRLKADGAIAVKFDTAYFRSLSVGDPSYRQARRIYERYRTTTNVPDDEYRQLQDYLFHYLLREVTALGLPVHIHTGVGEGNAFRLSNAQPLLLENLFTLSQYRATQFVLLQGGYPFTHEAVFLAAKPNVFISTAGLSLRLYPQELSRILLEWLSLYPEKILFGTDAKGVSDLVDAEEMYWLATESGRHALALALTSMVQEKRCSEAEALRLARLLLHDNAAKLYGLP